MKKVSIIIVTWKGMKWIEKCLNSIRQSTYPATVFLIDNNSPDETPNFIKQNFPEIKITTANQNLGFGKANNLAIKQAISEGYDYFFLLNQDAYLHPDTIENLIKVAENGEYGIISPIHLNGDGSKVDFYFRDFVLGKCPDFINQSVTGGNRIIFESEFIPAAGWFLPRKTIEELGGFDSLFYHYGEDDNFCQRCRYHQRKIVFTTNAFIRHDREATVGNQTMYNHKLAYRHLIQDAANILYSKGYIIQKIGRQFYDEIGLFLMYLLTGKWKMLHNFPADYFKLLCQIPAIRRSRILNKTLHGIQ
ncbi:glycosyltransferase family 2 protein [Phocaeicola plebeius]|uniref:glycosyltransferase family 2 protein n=1 Tax=Phocaeicola plebeius TaxID=310297 RepID=UPI00320B05C7